MKPSTTYRVDWDRVRDQVVARLQSLIRFDTTNPPGNETPAAEWLADQCRAAGIACRVLEAAPGRGSAVARLPGAGQAPPLLLMSHLDVVPAEAERWSHPPFAAELHDGYIWGRGALDMKSITAQHLTLLLLFKARADAGRPLDRDLILMAAADEERGGELGAHWLARHHPDLIRAEVALNEGAGQTVRIGERDYMTIQAGEKGFARFRLVARGEPGHASIPRQDSAVLRLAEAVLRVGRASLPAHLPATTRSYLAVMVDTQPERIAAPFRAMIEDPTAVDRLLPQLPLDDLRRRFLHACTHNTAAPTILAAGSKINVLPSEAIARVDGRTLPGFDSADLRRELAPFLPDGIEMVFEEEAPPLETDLAGPLYDAIRQAVAAHAPDVILTPMLLTGATDAKAVVPLGTRVYGFGPLAFEPQVDGLGLVHGHDERISVRNLLFGTRLLFDVVERLCGAGR